jgi:hypothetical protein
MEALIREDASGSATQDGARSGAVDRDRRGLPAAADLDPLGQRPGLGTIANALIVGPVLDLGVAVSRRPRASRAS